MEVDLKRQAEQICQCSRVNNNHNREIVHSGLNSKWEGLQSVALQVLGQWGDDESRALLRDFIERIDDRRHGWAIRGVAVKALSSCVTAADSDWALDRLFSLKGVRAKHEFLPVVRSLPLDAARTRLLSESSSRDRDNRQAAMKAIGNMDFEERGDLLRGFLKDEDSTIRQGASAILANISN